MRFQHILEKVYLRPWMITPQAHASIVALLNSKLVENTELVNRLDKRGDEDDADFWAVTRKPMRMDANGIAHIQILGPIGKGLSGIEKSCGGATGVEEVSAELKLAARRARGVLLYVCSPGGTITGVPELAREVSEMPIPVVAFTDDMIASAAYYISAGCREIWASESAEVGSIGVYIPWMDKQGYYDEWGISPNPVVNTEGRYKALGFWPTLSEDHRAFLQAGVDDSFSKFKNWVLNFRAVPAEAMQGQCLPADKALETALIDGIGTYDAAVESLLKLIR